MVMMTETIVTACIVLERLEALTCELNHLIYDMYIVNLELATMQLQTLNFPK